jgi:hypothetical protein
VSADPLAALRDIHLPGDPSWWPPAPGWWVLATLLAALAFACARWLPRAWRRRGARRDALRELEALRRHRVAPALVAELSVLLRRVAMSRDLRREVAGLSGESWLAYLDREAPETAPPDAFRHGPGRCLASAPYGGPSPEDPGPLLDLVEAWIRRNAGVAARR